MQTDKCLDYNLHTFGKVISTVFYICKLMSQICTHDYVSPGLSTVLAIHVRQSIALLHPIEMFIKKMIQGDVACFMNSQFILSFNIVNATYLYVATTDFPKKIYIQFHYTELEAAKGIHHQSVMEKMDINV